jgi:hypothetical protein
MSRRVALFFAYFAIVGAQSVEDITGENVVETPEVRCENVSAPRSFEIRETVAPGATLPTNHGIIPTGFVDLPGREVTHGIDVSKFQEDVNFQAIYSCGGRFAYVRLSGGSSPENELLYRTHWANARASGLIPGPYHNLSLQIILPGSLAAAAPSEIEQAVALSLEDGRANAVAQARLFLARLDEVRGLDPREQGAPPPFLPIALDLSYRPLPTGSAEQKSAYGALFREMICSFVGTIRSSSYGAWPIMLFVNPEDYLAYGMDAAPCGLESAPLWLRQRPRDGSDFSAALSADTVRRLCRTEVPSESAGARTPSPVGRCIMEQYTSFGGFAVFQPGAPLDLNRFFGSQEDLRRFSVGGVTP